MRPFDNGTQFMAWRHRNCVRCAKQWNNGYFCEIEMALDEAYITDGEITAEIAKRMQLSNYYTFYTWDCPERQEQHNGDFSNHD